MNKYDKTILRLKSFLQHEGWAPDVYLEMMEHIEELGYQLHYFSGDEYKTADDLARWGFLKKIISPIIKDDGSYIGNNVYFASLNATLKIDMDDCIKDE
jgi:hypothetical protein